MSPRDRRPAETDPVPNLENLDAEELRAIVAKAAESHEDVARAVRCEVRDRTKVGECL